MSDGLFGDLLVIDCASFIAGPAAATVMSDLGARVIKIEPPGLGDSYRNLIRLRGEPGAVDYFWTLDSRNKESVALDLKTPAARAVLETLIAKADVFITNFPFPIRERLGLRAADLIARNRRLIYASLTPYGEEGPERDLTGYDLTAWWARSGLMDMVRERAGAPAASSVAGMGDHPTAMALYGAIVTALYRRQTTGEGGVVSTSLLANGLWANGCQVQAALCEFELTQRPPRGQRPVTYAEEFVCADGRSLILACLAPREWPALCHALERPEWENDPRFATPLARAENGAAMLAEMEAQFASAPFEHWRTVLTEHAVSFGIVGRIEDHIIDEQVAANRLLPFFEDGDGLQTVDSPFQIDGEIKRAPRMAPGVGQHTRAVLEEFGIDAELIAAVSGQ